MADLSTGSGAWKWNNIRHLFPRAILERILAISPPNITDSENDVCFGGGSVPGKFSISAVFDNISTMGNDDGRKHWKDVWNIKVPERIKVFVWLIYQNGLKINL